jgi:hypothetical protein
MTEDLRPLDHALDRLGTDLASGAKDVDAKLDPQPSVEDLTAKANSADAAVNAIDDSAKAAPQRSRGHV